MSSGGFGPRYHHKKEIILTDSNYTHLLTIVDRSGSMAGVKDDMIGGLNDFFKAQAKEDGKCLVDYVQFDNTVEHVYADKDVKDAEAILVPRGMTALYDAIGMSVTDLGKRFAEMAEGQRPGNVIVVVVTDGYENNSKEWRQEAIKELIKQQEDEWGWTFTFLGADMDAVEVGATMGFKSDYSLSYDKASIGATSMALASNVTRTRGGDKTGYSAEERNAAVGN